MDVVLRDIRREGMDMKGFLICLLFCSFVSLDLAYSQQENVCSGQAKEFGLEGSRLMQEGQFTEAADSFKKALDCDSKCLAAYLGIGGCYASLGQHEKAIAIYESGIKEIPKYISVFRSSIAAQYMFLREYEKAITYLKESIELFPEDQQAFLFLGSAYHKVGDSQNAKINFQKAAHISLKNNDAATAKLAQDALKAIQ